MDDRNPDGVVEADSDKLASSPRAGGSHRDLDAFALSVNNADHLASVHENAYEAIRKPFVLL